MQMRRILLVGAVATLSVGCTAKYQISNLSGATEAKLDRQKSVFIAVPQDGAYGSKNYQGSGQTVAQAVAAAFSRTAQRVHIADRYSTATEAIEQARMLGAGYAVVPVVAHWEQRATEWSGRPSTMSIRVTILDASSGKQLAVTAIEGRSRIVSWTATSPDSLLREPLAEYVASIY